MSFPTSAALYILSGSYCSRTGVFLSLLLNDLETFAARLQSTIADLRSSAYILNLHTLYTMVLEDMVQM